MTGLEHVRFADEELIKTQVLKGEAAQTIIRGENCSVYKMENETGEGVITRYPVFPGIELLYDDIHMSCGVAHREDPRADLLEINHCRTGRFECEFSDGRAVYLGEGDLAVNVMTNRTRETWFPLSHYHGITIAVDIPVADRVLRQVSEALGEGLYCDLFAMRDRLCAHNSCFVMRAADSIQHIFSELYHAPEDLRAGYFKQGDGIVPLPWLPRDHSAGRRPSVCRPIPGRTDQICPAVLDRAFGPPDHSANSLTDFFLSADFYEKVLQGSLWNYHQCVSAGLPYAYSSGTFARDQIGCD